MTMRNRVHSRIMVRTAKYLDNWFDEQPPPRGAVLSGEVGRRLRRNPDTTVGLDVACISAELVANQTDETTLIDGVPLLAVEILSPSDTEADINEKVDLYQAAGVPLIWVIDPHDRTVLVYRHGVEPMLVNVSQEHSGDPVLPGFRVQVARLFE